MNLRNLSKEQTEDVKEVVKEEISDVVGAVKGMFNDSGFKKGKTYLIRTVTMVNVGKVKKVTPRFVTLSNASWIADTGKFGECLTDASQFKEVETFPNDLVVSIRSIIDYTEWNCELPTRVEE